MVSTQGNSVRMLFRSLLVLVPFLLLVCVYSVSAAKPASSDATAAARSSCPESAEDVLLDLEQLENGIRKTKAVGMMTKLKLKGEINDLLDEVETYHGGSSPFALEQVREHFDLLYMKVVSLIQDKDPDLHLQLCASWDLMWDSLQDPLQFKALSSLERGNDHAYL